MMKKQNNNIHQQVIDEVRRRNQNFYPSMTLAMEDDPRNSVSDRLLNRLSVGEVIRNRSDISGSSPEQVALFQSQFSPWNMNQHPFDHVDALDPQRVAEAYNDWDKSAKTNFSKGATHFYNPAVSKPDWRNDGSKTETVGRGDFKHIFLKGIDFPQTPKHGESSGERLNQLIGEYSTRHRLKQRR